MPIKPKISVLGCCVSREMFNFSCNFDVVSTVYSSFISMFEPKIDISYDDCVAAISPHFQARNAYLECNKKVFEYLDDKKGDYLLIDFAEVVDDYYDVEADKNSGSHVRIVANPVMKELLSKKGFNYTRISSRDCDIEGIVKNLFDHVFSLYAKEKVILNKTTLSDYYIEGEEIRKFEEHYRLLQKNIDKVRAFEKEAEKYVFESNVLSPLNYSFSDVKHQHGLSPVHYTPEDYLFMIHRLEKKFGIITDNILYDSYSALYEKYKGYIVKLIKVQAD